MKRVAGFVIGMGGRVDALAVAVRATPRSVRCALAVARHRRTALLVALFYLLAYLLAIGDIAISASGQFARFVATPSIHVVPDWTDRILAARAPLLYEPVVSVYPFPALAVFVSPGDIAIGALLGALLGVNIAVSAYAASSASACRRRRLTGAVGTLPTFLLGFGCCAPTFVLLLGTNVAAAVMPVFVPLRPLLFPGAIALMASMLVWSARRASTAPAPHPTFADAGPNLREIRGVEGATPGPRRGLDHHEVTG